MVYNPQYTIYKPGFKDYTKGVSSAWEFNPEKRYFFLCMAKQNKDKNDNGNPTFDWKGGERMKLDIPDLAEILLLLSGQKSYLGIFDEKAQQTQKGKGLFHKNNKGNTILRMYKHPSRGGCVLEFSSKKEALFQVAQLLSEGECITIMVILQRIIWELYREPSK